MKTDLAALLSAALPYVETQTHSELSGYEHARTLAHSIHNALQKEQAETTLAADDADQALAHYRASALSAQRQIELLGSALGALMQTARIHGASDDELSIGRDALQGIGSPLNAVGNSRHEHITRELAGALSFALEQIEQMKGMFDENDQDIANALRDGYAALDSFGNLQRMATDTEAFHAVTGAHAMLKWWAVPCRTICDSHTMEENTVYVRAATPQEGAALAREHVHETWPTADRRLDYRVDTDEPEEQDETDPRFNRPESVFTANS